MFLADQIEDSGRFRMISRGTELPVLTFTTAHDVK
jgi:hypothetical protein